MRVIGVVFLILLWTVGSLWYIVLRHRLSDDEISFVGASNNDVGGASSQLPPPVAMVVVVVFASTVDRHRHVDRLMSMERTWANKNFTDNLGVKVLYAESSLNNTSDSLLSSMEAFVSNTSDSRQLINAATTVLSRSDTKNVEWLVKIDDLTFVIVENLVKLLRTYDHQLPLCVGKLLSTSTSTTNDVFPSGGAGFALSRAAIERIVSSHDCNALLSQHYLASNSDQFVSKCANLVNVSMVDTRDSSGGDRFLVYNPVRSVLGATDNWYRQYVSNMNHIIQTGTACCAMDLVTFHYIESAEARVLFDILHNASEWRSMSTNDRQAKWPKWPAISGYSRAPTSFDLSHDVWRLLLDKVKVSNNNV